MLEAHELVWTVDYENVGAVGKHGHVNICIGKKKMDSRLKICTDLNTKSG